MPADRIRNAILICPWPIYCFLPALSPLRRAFLMRFYLTCLNSAYFRHVKCLFLMPF